LVLTGRLEPNLVTEAKEAGASGFLVKTNASTELLDAVRTVLAGGNRFGDLTLAAQEPGALSAADTDEA